MIVLGERKAWLGSDNLVRVGEPPEGLRNPVTGAYMNAAAVACTLTDAQGAEVSGETWPASAQYVPDSDGEYRYTLSKDLGVAEGLYELLVEADGGTDLYQSWLIPIRYLWRTS